jgi:hypothetical protein
VTNIGAADGTLQMQVWPSHVGVCDRHPGLPPAADGEPLHDDDYVRGQIHWASEKIGGVEQIVGRTFVQVPPGEYTHIAFFSGPTGLNMVGASQLEQPLRITESGQIEVYPITNPALELNHIQGVD